MRAVLDTNVAVSALIWGGIPFDLLEAGSNGRVDLATSPFLLEELAEVLQRPHLSIRLQRVRGSVEEALAFDAAFTNSVTPASGARAVPGDPDDDHVIAAAIAAGADIIASGDRRLLTLGTYQAIRILLNLASSMQIPCRRAMGRVRHGAVAVE
jgi:putative PIN family toxin of toxin-antitoxin system